MFYFFFSIITKMFCSRKFIFFISIFLLLDIISAEKTSYCLTDYSASFEQVFSRPVRALTTPEYLTSIYNTAWLESLAINPNINNHPDVGNFKTLVCRDIFINLQTSPRGVHENPFFVLRHLISLTGEDQNNVKMLLKTRIVNHPDFSRVDLLECRDLEEVYALLISWI